MSFPPVYSPLRPGQISSMTFFLLPWGPNLCQVWDTFFPCTILIVDKVLFVRISSITHVACWTFCFVICFSMKCLLFYINILFLFCFVFLVQFRADSIQDLSQSLTEVGGRAGASRSPSFPGELFRLRTNSDGTEDEQSLAALAAGAVSQQKRHSFGLGVFFFLSGRAHRRLGGVAFRCRWRA